MSLKKILLLLFVGALTFNTADAKHPKKHKKVHRSSVRHHRRGSRPQKGSAEPYNFEEARSEADSAKSKRNIDIPFNANFTSSEILWVKVKTPGLFGGNSRFNVDLTDLSDSAKWHMPLPGCHIISPFGGRRKHHSGDDIKTRPNDRLYAVFDGVVRLSRAIGGYGNVLVIRHPNGLETVYSHNSRNFVHSGDTVRAGDVVGLTGRTGRATTEHCHFELRINGQAVNPVIMFDFAGNTIKKGIYTATAGGTLKRADSYDGELIPAFSNVVKIDPSDSVAVAKDAKERNAYAKSVYTGRHHRHHAHKGRHTSSKKKAARRRRRR